MFEKGIRPAFGSVAGKKALAETIVSYIPDHKIYVEPFAGGAAVFFKKKPSEIEVLNDKDSEISFAFKFIKAGNFKELERFKIEGNREYFERLKSHKPKSDVERFHKFLYLIHFSFANSRESFAESTMTGDRKTMSARIDHLPLVTERLKIAKIYNQDFRDIIKAWESNQTFFYFDPPYPDQKGRLKTDLTNEDIYNALKNIKCKWILSLADSKGGRETFKNFHIKTVTVERIFNQNTRHLDTELLISNYPLHKTNTWLSKVDTEYEVEEEHFDTDFLEKGIRPAFGSPGGKRYLASTIVTYIPDHRKYVEPFAGGAAIFFAKKQSETEILNDKDPEISFAYKFLRDINETQIEKLKEKNWEPSKNFFDTLKSKQIKNSDEIERFHKHIYLQQWSTGGMKDHFSDGGEWNYSEYPKSITRWQIYKERLKGVKVYNRDFQEIIKEHDSVDTFFYLDPPYPKHWPGKDFGFNPDSLKEILKSIKGKFILSYPIEAKDDFKEFNIKIVETEKHIIGRPKEMRKEILVSNFPFEKSETWLQKDYLDKGIRQAFGSPGGKKFLAHIIASYIPEHKTYIESFAGGAAVYFAKKPSEVEILNDYDFQIANAYRTIKEENPDMIHRASNLKDWISRVEGLRMAWRDKSSGIKGFLNYLYGLRGSFSSNRYSIKRSEIGRSLKPAFSNLEKLKERLKNTKILNQDYSTTFKYDSKDTFYYFDPPYPGEWPREDIHEKFDLKEFIDCIKTLKGKFIISINKENKKYFKDMDLHFKEVERITTFTRPDQQEDPNHRSYDIELLVSNFPLHKTGTWLAKSDLEEKELYLPEFVWIPNFISLTGTAVYGIEEPHDLDLVIRCDGDFNLQVDDALNLKLNRVISENFPNKIQHLLASVYGPNWRHIPLYDLVLRPKKKFRVIDVDEKGFAAEFYKSSKPDEPYMSNPAEDKEYRYVIQHHYRGISCHADFRVEINDHFIGWTIMDLMPGKIKKPVLTLKDARQQDARNIFKINWKTGEFKVRENRDGTKRKTEILSTQKAMGPRIWLDVEGVAEPGETGSTAKYPGVFHIIDKGVVEFGAQKDKSHEYFLEGNILKGRFIFRLLERKEAQKTIEKCFEEGYTRQQVEKKLLFQKLLETVTGDSKNIDELKKDQQLHDAILILLEGEHFRKQVCPGGNIIDYIFQQENTCTLNIGYLRKLLNMAFKDNMGMVAYIKKVLPPAESPERTISPYFWVLIQPDDQTPYVLSKKAQEKNWMPPAGISALPKKVRKDVPERLRYWTIQDKTKALDTRNELIHTEGFGVGQKLINKSLLDKHVPIIKLDEEKQIAYGVVLEPDTVDAQGDRISHEEIEKACYWFMEHSQKFREMHEGSKIDARVIENYLAPQDLNFERNGRTEKVRKGAWIMGVKIYDPETWHKCKTGEYTGFSIGGYGLRREVA